ncbi:GntR family transcriptional regulator [Streptomyces orinoci]|uniref:GntR family transcriptional regulator n=1 Tax=Streptomyces orinoci TaxID=67339 RepID=A0ABV3JPS9_STRON|nr:GntR family transcriptional regulator [Streptomyces orinoci]
MASPGTSRRPKYQRIAADLRHAVQAGEYRPGDRLPGENDLMAAYQVARMTARQALGVLQSEGIAEARKGAGVFVRSFRPLRRRGIPSGPDINSVGLERAVEERRTPPPPVADALALPPTAVIPVRDHRFIREGKPVLLSTCYQPEPAVTPVRFREEIRCRMPSSEEVQQLRLPQGTPVIQIRRIGYAPDGRAVEVNELTMDSSSYLLEYEFQA